MDELKRKKRIYGIISIVIVVLLMGLLTLVGMQGIAKVGADPEEFRDYIRSFGAWGVFVGLGIQLLQIVVALIPGEVVEIGLGYAFGAVGGTVVCYVGIAIASTIIFILTKKLGMKMVLLFVDREKLDSMKFLQDTPKLKTVLFLLFFIPGIPKDALTYIVGLTKIKLSEFLVISLIARIPSVISSTIGGSMIGDGEYVKAIILFAITGLVSVAGLLIYNKIMKKQNTKKESEQEA